MTAAADGDSSGGDPVTLDGDVHRVSWHEAGHGVAAAYFGAPKVGPLSITPALHWSGVCFSTPVPAVLHTALVDAARPVCDWPVEARRELEARSIIFCAGIASTQWLMPQLSPGQGGPVSGVDVDRELERIPPAPFPPLEEEAAAELALGDDPEWDSPASDLFRTYDLGMALYDDAMAAHAHVSTVSPAGRLLATRW